MSFNLKPKLSMQKVKNHVGKSGRKSLRESQQRRDRLQKLAIMNTGTDVYVQISGDQAYANIAPKNSNYGYTDRVIINVPSEIPDQVSTNLDDKAWDLLFQKTELYHEVGHVLYTDWESYEETVFGDGNGNYGVPNEDRNMYSHFVNIIEDAAIERILTDRFNIGSDIRVKNENLLRASPPEKVISLSTATSMALMEYKHPLGWIDELLDVNVSKYQFLTDEDRETFEDEIYPEVEDRVPDILDESDPAERNYMIWDLYDAIIDCFDNSMKAGKTDDNTFNLPNDPKKNEGSSGKDPNQGSQKQGLPDPDMPDPKTGLSVDQQQDYNKQVQQDQDQDTHDEKTESLEEWLRVIDLEYDDGVTMSMKVPGNPPAEGTFNQQTMDEAKRLSQPLARDLGQRLHHQQQSNKQKKQKSGKIDPSQAHKTKQGKVNIFSRHSKPDEKDYSCMIVLDRSGSMRTPNSMIPEAEKAAGALAFALDDIGVDVGMVSMFNREINLEKDFADTVEESKEKMFRGCADGGTPLSEALGLARARFKLNPDGHPFMIVITDGEPDHRERYRDQLHMCNFPVLGVYINSSGDFSDAHVNESGYFHRLEMRKYDEALDGVRHLVKNVMF